MKVTPIKLGKLVPPQDDLLKKIIAAKPKIKEHDVIVLTSKVVSIWQGRCIEIDSADKDDLARIESEQYIKRDILPGGNRFFTIKEGFLISSAGIDESNANGYYILWPKDLQKTAQKLLIWFKKEYKKKNLYLIITDSHSIPLRRGAIGFTIAWAGFNPIYDYRGQKDIFNRPFKFVQTNIADSLAAAATLVMGEGAEQTPLAIISGAPYIRKNIKKSRKKFSSFQVPIKEDVYRLFLENENWKQGGK